MVNSRLMLVIAIVVAAALSRLLPHAPNLTPMTAVALFGGAYLGSRRLAFIVPLVALLLSDAIIGFEDFGQLLAVYSSIALIVALGLWVKSNRSVLRVGSAAISASVLFFVVTNFAVWVFSGIYAHTGGGLVQCYIAALPFFRNTLAGDVLYTALLFGGFALLERKVSMLREPAPRTR